MHWTATVTSVVSLIKILIRKFDKNSSQMFDKNCLNHFKKQKMNLQLIQLLILKLSKWYNIFGKIAVDTKINKIY